MTKSKHCILLAEDDHDLGHVLKLFLEMHELDVIWAKNGKHAISIFDEHHFDLCILDVTMPKKNGFEVAQYIYDKLKDTPFIFLTAKAQKHDRIRGLKLGAVDYITKPFEADELVLRIKNILRINPSVQKHNSNSIHEIGHFQLDISNLQLIGPSHIQTLTARECQLLELLSQKRNTLITKEFILTEIWGANDYFTGRSMDVFISRLRKYLASDATIGIERIRGEGIRLIIN